MIARKWSGVTGAVEDLATELDRFSVTFPDDATIQERTDRKSQVRQCLGFCTADLWPPLVYELAEQIPKYFLT